MSTWRDIRFGYPQAVFPIWAAAPRAIKPQTSSKSSPWYLGSRYRTDPSACLNARAQNMVQNRCAWAHRGSMPTSSMISQKSGCRRWIMADSAVPSQALSDRTAFERVLRSGTPNFMILPCRGLIESSSVSVPRIIHRVSFWPSFAYRAFWRNPTERWPTRRSRSGCPAWAVLVFWLPHRGEKSACLSALISLREKETSIDRKPLWSQYQLYCWIIPVWRSSALIPCGDADRLLPESSTL